MSSEMSKMRYYCYNEWNDKEPDNNEVVTVS